MKKESYLTKEMVSCKGGHLMFPGCSIVRVGTKKWKKRHTRILEDLLEMVRSFLSERSDMPFEQLRFDFENDDMRVLVGNKYAHVLYGPDPTFVSNRELKTDIKGLLFKPCARVTEDARLSVEL